MKKPTKEEKLIALATLVGLGRSVEILKAMVIDTAPGKEPSSKTNSG